MAPIPAEVEAKGNGSGVRKAVAIVLVGSVGFWSMVAVAALHLLH